MAIMTYRELIAWQRGMDLVVSVYALTADFPMEEKFGLTAQLRRAAISVPANIAEGQGRGSNPDFRRFLRIAMGSLCELETLVLLSDRLGLCTGAQAAATATATSEVGKLLNGLRKSLVDKR